MEVGVKYLVEGIKKVTVSKGTITGEKTIVDIKHPDDRCYSLFLPGRYNKASFLMNLPFEFLFEELQIEYLEDIVLGFNQPTPKLKFTVKTSMRQGEGAERAGVFSQFVPPSEFDEEELFNIIGDDDDENVVVVGPPQQPLPPPPPTPSSPAVPVAATAAALHTPKPSTSGLNKRAAAVVNADDKKKNKVKKPRIIMLSDDEDEGLMMNAAKAADSFIR